MYCQVRSHDRKEAYDTLNGEIIIHKVYLIFGFEAYIVYINIGIILDKITYFIEVFGYVTIPFEKSCW